MTENLNFQNEGGFQVAYYEAAGPFAIRVDLAEKARLSVFYKTDGDEYVLGLTVLQCKHFDKIINEAVYPISYRIECEAEATGSVLTNA